MTMKFLKMLIYPLKIILYIVLWELPALEKTTLLRILMGLEHADSGSVSGIDTKSISCMFQEDRLIPYLSAIDNVRIVLHGKKQ